MAHSLDPAAARISCYVISQPLADRDQLYCVVLVPHHAIPNGTLTRSLRKLSIV